MSLARRVREAHHILRHGAQGAKVRWSGRLTVDPVEFDRAIAAGWLRDGLKGWDALVLGNGAVYLRPEPNLVVNAGINIGLDRLFSIGGPPGALATIGVDNGTTNPTATSVSSTAGGGSDTGSSSRRLVAFDSTPTRASQVVSATGTFTNSTVSFAMKRLFLSKASAGTTDASGDLYAMTNVFTIDLTAFSSWSQTFTAQVTGTGS